MYNFFCSIIIDYGTACKFVVLVSVKFAQVQETGSLVTSKLFELVKMV